MNQRQVRFTLLVFTWNIPKDIMGIICTGGRSCYRAVRFQLYLYRREINHAYHNRHWACLTDPTCNSNVGPTRTLPVIKATQAEYIMSFDSTPPPSEIKITSSEAEIWLEQNTLRIRLNETQVHKLIKALSERIS
jgi:hypothetical protein